MKNCLLYLFVLALVSACTVEPRQIRYGDDLCEFCKMTVVDSRHGAELVTAKGKVYVFDAIECMVAYKKENQEPGYAHVLVNDYLEPGRLVQAAQAAFLISPAIPSPMGANLSASADREAMAELAKEKGGDYYSWEELLSRDGL